MTAATDRLPSDREFWRYLMAAWKENALAASFEFHLAHLQGMRRVTVPGHLSRQRVRLILRDIARQSPVSSFVAEAKSENNSDKESIACLAVGHKQPSGEPGYYVALMTEKSFPNGAFVSVAASVPPARSIVSIFTEDGWKHLTPSEVGSSFEVLAALTSIHEHLPSRIVRLPIEKIKMRAEDEPPLDAECMRRLMLVMRKKMSVTIGSTSFENLSLYDSEFAATLDPNRIVKYTKDTSRALLVYWNGNSFVSSDDELLYLAYRSLNLQQVNVAIMGTDFPSGLVRIQQRGDHKLLPPVGVEISEEKTTPGATKELRDWQEKQKENRDDRLPIPIDLLTAWIAFAELLSETDPSERELHEFLSSFPIVLGAQWDVAESEVSFGGRFRADIVLRAHRALPTVRLIELERANHRLFTKDLHETDEVTHAVQQVSDWVRYCRQNPQDKIIASSRGVIPDGIVIIGRSRSLTVKEREVLAHNNQGHDVKVLTYDVLLDDFGTLILHRLDNTIEP